MKMKDGLCWWRSYNTLLDCNRSWCRDSPHTPMPLASPFSAKSTTSRVCRSDERMQRRNLYRPADTAIRTAAAFLVLSISLSIAESKNPALSVLICHLIPSKVRSK
ncbi:unnamed protein product [Linum trigynum]|uniref:Uncharacterized protein n=1 Tax=Linum trigynum TaxID=586398 RepID=A0AAV2DCR7_9ROSI